MEADGVCNAGQGKDGLKVGRQSGVPGVVWDDSQKRWQSGINRTKHGKKGLWLGRKYFPANRYGPQGSAKAIEIARQAAVAYRKALEKEHYYYVRTPKDGSLAIIEHKTSLGERSSSFHYLYNLIFI